MSTAMDAVEKAAYQLLAAAPPIGAPVFQHVPEDTPPPAIIIGDMEATPLGPKGDADKRVSLTIVAVTEAEERKPLLALQSAIEDRLAGARMTLDGWKLAFTPTGETATLVPEGTGYVGESRFEILALRA